MSKMFGICLDENCSGEVHHGPKNSLTCEKCKKSIEYNDYLFSYSRLRVEGSFGREDENGVGFGGQVMKFDALTYGTHPISS